jgi:hypothetical protein
MISLLYTFTQAKATAETKDCVTFAVRLWNSSSNQIIVECQRSSGCCRTFCETATKVLKAASKGTKKSSSSGTKALKKNTIPSAVRDCVLNIPEEVMNESVQDCLQIACEMIKGGHLDSQQLAIESLLHVSDSYKTQAFCAMMIFSNELLLSTLISLVVYCNIDRNDTSICTDFEKECFSMMRRHALNVLANCFTTLDATKTFDTVITEKSMLLDINFLKTLVLFVTSAPIKPHEAADACKCLQMLCLHSTSTKQCVTDFGTSKYLKHAQGFRHATLHDASTNLLIALSS